MLRCGVVLVSGLLAGASLQAQEPKPQTAEDTQEAGGVVGRSAGARF